MEISNHWFGVLNAENIDAVAAQVREIVKGRFAIAEARYCDSVEARLEMISGDCETNSEWTTAPTREPVRVFRPDSGPWFGFSAAGYLWMFHAREDNKQDHEDYRYPYFSFEHNKFTVTQRAPAGKGYLHKRAFSAHRTGRELS